MENKLNIQELESYSKLLARKLCRDYFQDTKKNIEGKEILKFTPIDQINYFILKNLFTKWKDEIAQLKQSPYFNYENPEVESALQNLMNELSNHILIKTSQFEILVATAIEESIYLALSPYHYFKIYFFYPEKIKVTLAELKEKSKYVKLNSSFFNHFIEKLESYRIQSFMIADIMGYFQESYYSKNDSFDDFEPIIEKLSAIVPLSLEKIVTDLKKKDDYAPTPLEIFENQRNQSSQPQSIPQTQPQVQQQPIRTEPDKILFSAGVSNNIAPIKLSLNQRIMFQKELFSGDSEQMNLTLARLESAGSMENAKYILGFLNWDKESEITQEFHDLIESRYK